MTGSLLLRDVAAVQTLRYKQSSPEAGGGSGDCVHGSANESARLTPRQGGGFCGGLHRSDPTGGAANGIPLNEAMPSFVVPPTVPPVTRACVIAASTVENARVARGIAMSRPARIVTSWACLDLESGENTLPWQ